MPTARELLEQADALMRRNRGDPGIPVLTDSVPDIAPPAARERAATPARAQGGDMRVKRDIAPPREDHPRVAEAPRAAIAAPDAGPTRGPDALAAPERRVPAAEPPLLTDAVEVVVNEIRPSPFAAAEGDPSLWLGPDTVDPALHSITGPAPDTVAVVPPVTLRATEPKIDLTPFEPDRDPTVTRTLRAAGSAPTPPPAGSTPPSPPPEPPTPGAREPVVAAVNDDERWRALAEQISMQVLQRLDLFIDTGLKAQLAGHLQPIVARASAELVEAINDQVGQLVRTYVAEAIEREIAQWRLQNK
jgi:hypothetical protein